MFSVSIQHSLRKIVHFPRMTRVSLWKCGSFNKIVMKYSYGISFEVWVAGTCATCCHLSIYRSSLPEVICKKGVVRHFAKFTGKHLCQSLFFNKVAAIFLGAIVLESKQTSLHGGKEEKIAIITTFIEWEEAIPNMYFIHFIKIAVSLILKPEIKLIIS